MTKMEFFYWLTLKYRLTFKALFNALQGKNRCSIIASPEEFLFLSLLVLCSLLLPLPGTTATTAAPLWPTVASPCGWLFCLWSIITIQSLSSENTSSTHINWSLNSIQALHVNLSNKVLQYIIVNKLLDESKQKRKFTKCLQKLVGSYAYIKEHNVSIGISIMSINTIKPLRKLHIADSLSQ